MTLQLTRDNYYSKEADIAYLSHSQYNNFLQCEAMAMALINREWIEPANDNLLVGSYVHAWNEGTLEEFKAKTPEMFKKDGTPYAKFLFADQMVATLQNDPFCMFVLDGQKEVIMTAEMFGAPWKIRIDSYNPEKRRIVDLKTTRSINDLVWSDERWAKVSFVDAYNYPRQMAIYCEVERLVKGQAKWGEPLIVAVSKEGPPDKAIISLVDDARFEMELRHIEENLPRILAIKQGLEPPQRCGKCPYCRSTKKIDGVIHYSTLGLPDA